MAECPYRSVEEYIDSFEPEMKKMLYRLRELIREEVPEAVEKLSWGAPTYDLDGYLLQFAGNKRHVGFYTTAGTIAHFKKELEPYETNSKNTTRFPVEKELPEKLIREMVRFRVEEHRMEKK